MEIVTTITKTQKEFHIKILGRMLEHLGVQMYKRRDAAIAELVANCWDAGANNVWINISAAEDYNQLTSNIIIEDDGTGMDETDLEDKYLVIGRNRREDENSDINLERKVMGRKGIGKLAGFGIATQMTVETWKNDKTISITLDLNLLKGDPSDDNIEKSILGEITNEIPEQINGTAISGTRIILSNLKQASSLNLESLHTALARRFSRTVQGIMRVFINNDSLKDFSLPLHPNSKKNEDEYININLEDGNPVKYHYVFTEKPIAFNELRGWTILVNGKTAQAPNFFFNVDADGAYQHSSKYLCGWIEADYLDEGIDDKSDFVSTDRQEIDWERPETKSLWEWGRKITKGIFEEIGTRNAETIYNFILEDQDLMQRVSRLGSTLEKDMLKYFKTLGQSKIRKDDDIDRYLLMAEQIVKAHEYEHFFNVVDQIKEASDNPDELNTLVSHLLDWEVLESRAILEIIKGRLVIIDKFHSLVVNDAPETANRSKMGDNMHDLIAGFPWLLNPEWQVLEEEKSVTKQLKDWGLTEAKNEDDKKRFDFLGLTGNGNLVIIEIKRSDHPVELSEVQRIDTYKQRLSKAHSNITCVLIYGGNHNLESKQFRFYSENRDDFKVLTWEEIYQRNYNYYNHYKAVLEGHIQSPEFARKKEEVQKTREVILTGSVYRSPEERKKGLGPQDFKYEEPNNPAL